METRLIRILPRCIGDDLRPALSLCTAADLGGDRIKIEKDGKSSWRPMPVTYRYYAGVLDRSSFLAENEAYFSGSNLFIMVEGLRDETQVPREDANTFIARDYDPDPRLKVTLRTTGESELRDRWLRRANG